MPGYADAIRSISPPPSMNDIADKLEDGPHVYGGAVGGTGTAITLTHTRPITALVAGQRFTFSPTATNTGATTINIDGLGAKAITDNAGYALIGYEIRQNYIVDVIYNGTAFILLTQPVFGGSPVTPTYGASESMTFTGVTTFGRLWKHGAVNHMTLTATGTLGGTASRDILVTLPIAASAMNRIWIQIGGIFDTAVSLAGTSIIHTTSIIAVCRYDCGTWSLGAGKGFMLKAIWE